MSSMKEIMDDLRIRFTKPIIIDFFIDKKDPLYMDHCQCGMAIDADWLFCPMCGRRCIQD